MDNAQSHVVFSIIVPAYNAATHIRQCIESVLRQTFENFELLITDDGSFDATAEICDSYTSDKRVHVFHQKNGGHTSARNCGLKMSRGKYVLFLDSDDWLVENTLELCCSEIQKNDSDIIAFGLRAEGSAGAIRNNAPSGFYDLKDKNNVIFPKLLMSENGDFAVVKSLSAKVFRRDVIYDSQMCLSPEIRIGEDGAAFVGAMLRAHTLSVLPEALYCCHISDASISKTPDRDALKRVKLLTAYYAKLAGSANADFQPQVYRAVVAQLFTALEFVFRSGGSFAFVKQELKAAMADKIVGDAVERACFNRKALKMRFKHFCIRHPEILWVIRLREKRKRE